MDKPKNVMDKPKIEKAFSPAVPGALILITALLYCSSNVWFIPNFAAHIVYEAYDSDWGQVFVTLFDATSSLLFVTALAVAAFSILRQKKTVAGVALIIAAAWELLYAPVTWIFNTTNDGMQIAATFENFPAGLFKEFGSYWLPRLLLILSVVLMAAAVVSAAVSCFVKVKNGTVLGKLWFIPLIMAVPAAILLLTANVLNDWDYFSVPELLSGLFRSSESHYVNNYNYYRFVGEALRIQMDSFVKVAFGVGLALTFRWAASPARR